MKRLLKGGIVVSEQGMRPADVLMDEASGKIEKVSEDISAAADTEVVDVTGKLLFPGFIDGHTHFELEVAGTVTADDFTTGTKAAIVGGTTTILDFCTQYKGESLHKALENWHKKADGKCSCDYGFHVAISDWNPEISRELAEMEAEGITSYKLYMTYDDMVLDDREIYQVLKRLNEVGGIAGVHCENTGLIKALVEEKKAAGELSPAAHPKTRPDGAEAEAVDRLLKLAAQADAPIIVVHLSSAAGYREVEHARKDGQEVYLETCPQYLVMDDSLYEKPDFEGAKYVCSPPLRKKADQVRLWNAIEQDGIQTLATDHCSFTLAQKAMGCDDFTKIPNGMPGVESRPVLFYTYGVKKWNLPESQMCRLLSANPAKLYGMYPQKGCIAEGSDADIVVWDPEASWTLSVENQQAKTDYCPLEGTDVQGKAAQVYLRGVLAAEDGKVVKELTGRYVKRGKRQGL